jgi:hypothetical protein
MINFKKLDHRYLAVIFAVVLVAAGVIYYFNFYGNVSAQKAGEISINFINKTIAPQGVTASLVEVINEGDFYGIKIDIAGQEYYSYLYKDGNFLFPSGFDLRKINEEDLAQEQAVAEKFEGDINAFAKCLSEKGLQFYGSKYCGYCSQQKELFGESLQYVNYIECVDENDQWKEECSEIQSVPTWVSVDGQKSAGFKTINQLAELSGCPLE